MKLDEKNSSIYYKCKTSMGYFSTEVEIFITITKYDKDVCVVEFKKLSGPLMSYYTKVKFIKKEYLDPLSEHYEIKIDDQLVEQ